MLLSDFKAVADLDTQISLLHHQLKELYDIRTDYIHNAVPKTIQKTVSDKFDIFSAYPTTTSTTSSKTKAQLDYNQLKAAWATYDIKLPSYASLKTKLHTAHARISQLTVNYSELSDSLVLVAIPPFKLFNLEIYPELILKNKSKAYIPTFYPELGQGTRSSTWRIFIVYSAARGLSLGNAKTILEQKKYIMNGYDMRGLGILEYAAFTLQNELAIDVDVWALLLRNYKLSSGKLVPSVAYTGGRYRFELDEAIGLLDNEYFRPALEIK